MNHAKLAAVFLLPSLVATGCMSEDAKTAAALREELLKPIVAAKEAGNVQDLQTHCLAMSLAVEAPAIAQQVGNGGQSAEVVALMRQTCAGTPGLAAAAGLGAGVRTKDTEVAEALRSELLEPILAAKAAGNMQEYGTQCLATTMALEAPEIAGQVRAGGESAKVAEALRVACAGAPKLEDLVAQELAAQEAAAPGPPPGTKAAGNGFFYKGVKFEPTDFGVTNVIGEMINQSMSDSQFATFTLSVYGDSDELVATAPIVMQSFSSGATKSFSAMVQGTHRSGKYKIQFENAF